MKRVLMLSGTLIVGLSGLRAASPAGGSLPPEAVSSGRAAAYPNEKTLTDEKVLFDFEKGPEGWRIPDWAFGKADNAAVGVVWTPEHSSRGRNGLKLVTDFPPKKWNGAYVEIEREPGAFMDFNGFDLLEVDVFLPENAPMKLKAQFILTVGEDWTWTEMRQEVELTPGEWTKLKADVRNTSLSWKAPMTDEIRADVRKLGVRIQSNSTPYLGPVYFDNVRLAKRS